MTIKASSVADTTKSSSAYATVPAIRVSAISPNSALLPQNSTQQFSATVDYDASNQGVAWSLSQNGAACSPTCGTIDPATTKSSAATTYIGPATVPAKTTVTLNAASIANEAKVASTNLTLTNGTVKLVPANLDFECKSASWGGSDCPPPSQLVTLTNAGASALTVSSIAITGSTQFSQTNDCGGSVNPGSSCTITVSFAATEDDVTGNMVIKDSSVDSPQQVSLTGITSAMDPANTAMARSDLATTSFAVVPPPTGQDIVGTQVLYLKDSALEDPYLANGTKRELAVRMWYPARSSALSCQPAEYTSPAVWQYYAEIVGVAPFAVKTNSCWDAPVADGVHPVVVFTPGYTATATDYTFLLEDLASRGYVVVAINHTYEATAVDLGHGRLARSVVGSHLGGPMLRDRWSLASAVSVRLLDLKFVVSEIESLNASDGSPFAGKLDLARIGVVGHSMGGLTAYLSLESDPRLKAAVMLDGFAPEVLGSPTRKPLLVISAGRQWRAEDCRLWKNLQGPRLAVNLSGTEHVALSDWIWLARNAVKTGPMGPEKTMDAVRDYVAEFLDANLRGDRSAPLLSGPLAAYSDAQVTGADQPLCREQ